MKRTISILILVIFGSIATMAQAPPPPPPADAGAASQGPVGGNAPIGSGLGIMLAMVAAWGGKKTWDAGKISAHENSVS